MNRLTSSSLLSFAASVLLAHSPMSEAAPPAGSAQSQAASILVAASPHYAGDSDRVPSQMSIRGPDVHEQARSLLLSTPTFDAAQQGTLAFGTRSPAVPASVAAPTRRPVANAQEHARAVILGLGV